MQIETSRPRWGILFGIFLLLGTLAALPFFFLRPKPLPPFEIQNFVGKVEVYSPETKAWGPPRRGQMLTARYKIRTAAGAEADLRVPDQIRIRLKEKSELYVRQPRFFEQTPRLRLHLARGKLLGSTEKPFQPERLEISTPTLVAAVRGTTFQIEANPETKESSVRVLRGTLEVRSTKTRKSVLVKTLERTAVKTSGPPLAPVRVTRQEWDQMKEAYELVQKSAAMEARQLDLSKEAGNLFEFVFDHGTFYTPKFGYAGREFIKDEAAGQVRLEVEYDVFPVGSFVGVYLKTRNLDLSQFKGFEFQTRGDPEEGFPQSLRIELKTSTGILRIFNPKDFKSSWQSFGFPFRFNRETLITEITLVFSNEKAGDHKKGVLQFRNFTLLPRDKPAKASEPRDTTQRS